MDVDWDDVLPASALPAPLELVDAPAPAVDVGQSGNIEKRTAALRRRRAGAKLHFAGLTVPRAKEVIKAFNMRERKTLSRADASDDQTQTVFQSVVKQLRSAGIRLPSSVACRVKASGRAKGVSLRMKG